MIRSMTAFGNGRADSAHGSVTIELRTVNSRYLDINFRLPDDLRMIEGLIRDNLGQVVARGKVDVRVNYTKPEAKSLPTLDAAYLASVAEQLQVARRVIPDVPAPNLHQLADVSAATGNANFDPEIWSALSLEATKQALVELQAAREREGQRLASIMLDCASDAAGIVDAVEANLPTILADHREKIVNKLRDTLMAVSPDGYSQISGAELSARIAQEASLFALRIDVAEELARLRSHIAELQHLLGTGHTGVGTGKKGGSAGKRLDFLFQEMNREANTLGSKASALSVTRAAIDLKLLIEQMREQAQNIE